MASAQVLPNSAASSRKGHLEAGKRRLEEFRKKKAAEQAKKAASVDQLHPVDITQSEKESPENEGAKINDSDGPFTSGRDSVASIEASRVFTTNGSKAINSFQISEKGSSNGPYTVPLDNNYDVAVVDPLQKAAKDQESMQYSGSRYSVSAHASYEHQEETNNYIGINSGGLGGVASEITKDQSISLDLLQGVRGINSNANQSSYYSIGDFQLKENVDSYEDHTAKAPSTSYSSVTSSPLEKSSGFPLQYKPSRGSESAIDISSNLFKDSIHPTTNLTEPEVEQYRPNSTAFSSAMFFDTDRMKLGSITDDSHVVDSSFSQASNSFPSSFSFDFKSTSNHISPYSAISESGTRRSRPSFLDSVNVRKVSSASRFPSTATEKAESFIFKSSKVHSMDTLASSDSEKPSVETEKLRPFSELMLPNFPSTHESSKNSSVSANNDEELVRQSIEENTMERRHEFHLPKQDDDFAALEQHIEDLTQEKFSLQRALEASRALAESLALENSSLTASYNQQGAVVNQLKSDLERLQEEIKAHLVELESVKIGFENAQLECNAADERAKLLTSEVISLEEKALRLRSSELKLERELENSNTEISSYRKKLSSLEKERQDFQSTIDALKEEKKLLQDKLRKASASGKSLVFSKKPSSTKDVSTSTEDLGVEALVSAENNGADAMSNDLYHEMKNTESFSINTSSIPLMPENRLLNVEASSAAIPPDQLRMIGNINTLISELAMEKEELMKALETESSHSSKLKELNHELSRKLETQTQRLELLTAQSMANVNIQSRQADVRPMHDVTPDTDEGDEVVERVLGWIMKFFPEGHQGDGAASLFDEQSRE